MYYQNETKRQQISLYSKLQYMKSRYTISQYCIFIVFQTELMVQKDYVMGQALKMLDQFLREKIV